MVWGKSAIGYIIIKHQWVWSLSGLKGLLFRLSGQIRRERGENLWKDLVASSIIFRVIRDFLGNSHSTFNLDFIKTQQQYVSKSPVLGSDS